MDPVALISIIGAIVGAGTSAAAAAFASWSSRKRRADDELQKDVVIRVGEIERVVSLSSAGSAEALTRTLAEVVDEVRIADQQQDPRDLLPPSD